MSTYEQCVSNFQVTTVAEVRSYIEAGDKTIVFIGRPTCPFCQRFVPKLANVNAETGAKIFYLESDNPEQLEDLSAFRKRYGIATVPALFVAEEGRAKVVCDSSLPEEDIKDFIV